MARIKLPASKEELMLNVNQLGAYPRVYVNALDTVKVSLDFSSSPPDTKVAVVAQDGGRLNDGKTSALLTLDQARQVAFNFKVTDGDGTHRVTITTPGADSKSLDFWVGQEAPLSPQ